MRLMHDPSSALRGGNFPRFDDPGVNDELLALWKDIFRHSQASEPTEAPEPGQAPSASAAAATGTAPASSAADGSTSDRGAMSLRSASSAGSASFLRARAPFAPADRAAVASWAQRPPASLSSDVAIDTTLVQRLSVQVPATAESGSSATTVTEAEAPGTPNPIVSSPPASDRESVQILTSGNALTVVVRDAALSPEAAVHCALETVRRLTGQSSSLHRVVLNGKTVYANRSVEPEFSDRAAPKLLFAC